LRSKVSIGEYIACLSVKYEVEPDELFGALVLAEENKESTCGDLSIRCRSKLQDRTVLLITNGPKVVAQFPVSKEFLLERSNPIEISKRTDMLRVHLRQKNKAAGPLHVVDMRPGMKRVSLKARVLGIAKPTLVFTKYGNYAKVANALVADETDTIKLCLWNEQINSISVGDTVQVENANVSMFRGERQVRIGKHGTLHTVKDTIFARGSTQTYKRNNAILT
jgi:replication factor A1